MVGVEDRNEDVAEEEASGPNSVPDVAALVLAPSTEDGGVIFVLEKASLEAAKLGKVKKTKEIPSPFLSGEEGGDFSSEGVVITTRAPLLQRTRACGHGEDVGPCC
jgi:hypothetical protein